MLNSCHQSTKASSTSPVFTAINNLGTTAGTTVIASNATRHGLIVHNPGTADVYIYQTGMATTPNITTLGGTLLIFPGGTETFPSPQFPNVNCGLSAFVSTGSSQPFTVIEFR